MIIGEILVGVQSEIDCLLTYNFVEIDSYMLGNAILYKKLFQFFALHIFTIYGQ